MKILAIRLKNLTSIEGMLEIDFTQEPLHSAGIFAISGATGAGKSTILDALCLALYDRAPRFAASVETVYLTDVGDNQISQADVKNILRRGMSEGYAEVDFIGLTGHRYRSHWSVRRTRSRADGSMRTQTMQVIDMDRDEEFQGSRKELLAHLVEVIGLSYEQFTRTVLLAQNDFSTFLKSRESAKAELLEKLTGTEIYSRISQEIFVRNKAAAEALNLLKSSMEFIELLPEEEFHALLLAKEKQVESRAIGIKQLALLNEQLNVIRSLKIQEGQWKEKQVEETVAIAKQEKLQQVLAQQTDGLIRFKEQCETLQPELRRARELDVQIQSLQTGYQQVHQALQQSQKQTNSLTRKQQTEREGLNTSCNVLNRLLSPETALSTSFQVGMEVSEELQLLEWSKGLIEVEKLLLREEKQLAGLQKENDDRVARLNAFDIRTLNEKQGKLQQEQTNVQRAYQAVNNLNQLHGKQQELIATLETLGKQLTSKEEQTRTLQHLYENARIAMSENVVALRNNLHESDPCPVCGSLSHPYQQGNEVADTLYHSIEKEYKVVSEAYKTLNEQCLVLQRDNRHLNEQQKTQEQLLIDIPEDQRTSEKLNGCLLQLQQQIKELSEKMDRYHQLYQEWQRQDSAVKTLRSHCAVLRESIAQVRLLVQKLTATTEQLTMAMQGQSVEETRFKTLNEELARWQKERTLLLKGKGVDESEAAVVRHEKLLNRELDLARKEVGEVQVRLSGLQGELKQLKGSIELLATQAKQIEELERLPEIIVAQQEYNLVVERELSATEAFLLQQQQNKTLLNSKQKELITKQEHAEQWGKLNKLIGSSDGTKFKVIAQSYTLNFLLRHANKHLSYLSRRYRLQQVPNTLALQVVDGDMCDEVRTVYSLSGGESFLISLALALGLSSLSSNNLKVESLFIDEGFGSLDADSLRMAMEALEQLQMQGRKIGVISHVQEMSERIAVQIQLNKSVNGKSEILIKS